MLQNRSTLLQDWKTKIENNEVVLEMDSNDDIRDEDDFSLFAQHNDLVDIATQFDPLLAKDPTYTAINGLIIYYSHQTLRK